MDSRIKIFSIKQGFRKPRRVSILVLMDSRIKMDRKPVKVFRFHRFNPCFNG